MRMDEAFEYRLLNEFQRDFPLCPAPFAVLAARLGVAERQVIDGLESLRCEGKVSRVGAVFAPHRVGASTLAAMAVPPHLLASVAAMVNRFAEVNHNYEREHRYNLWFVVTAANVTALQQTLLAIETAAGFAVLVLPLLEEFHIDLGFPLHGERPRCATAAGGPPKETLLDPLARQLIGALQDGLALVERPFARIGEQLAVSEAEVLTRLAAWLVDGAIKRFGVVVRHHELGFTANAMLVHDIPDAQVGDFGRALAEEAAVTLSYRRPRRLPGWGYNLFCMIHGRERAEVIDTIARLRHRHGLERYSHEVLFSRTRFKQNGARYA